MASELTLDGLKRHAASEMERLFRTVPFAQAFHTGAETHREYYKRHLIETILRIRLNNEVDAYSLYRIGYRNNALAQKLAQYLAEEYGHEHMFFTDLKRFGVTEEELNRTEPFFSTRLLIGYLYHAINEDGPMPTMVWNWFVEWYSDSYNMTIARKAEEVFGQDHVRGSMAHLGFDESHDHVSLMFSTVEKVMPQPGDGARVLAYTTNFVALIGQYFRELYDSTIAREPADAKVA